MKKFWKIAVLCALLAATCHCAAAQGRIETKKYKIRDLQERITKVVMTGNEFKDGALQQDIIARWRISPFEFCSLNEFKKLKTNKNYYFLITVTGRFDGESEAGIDFLTFVKGGPEASEGIDAMTEVVSIPFGTTGGTGREIAMLPALIDIIQDFSLKAMERDLQGYKGLSIYNGSRRRLKGKKLLFAEEDLSPRLEEAVRSGMRNKGIAIVPADDADDAMIRAARGTVVSYTVAPEQPSSASRCYKMLIDTETHALYYFKRHHISGKTGSGFLKEDVAPLTR